MSGGCKRQSWTVACSDADILIKVKEKRLEGLDFHVSPSVMRSESVPFSNCDRFIKPRVNNFCIIHISFFLYLVNCTTGLRILEYSVLPTECSLLNGLWKQWDAHNESNLQCPKTTFVLDFYLPSVLKFIVVSLLGSMMYNSHILNVINVSSSTFYVSNYCLMLNATLLLMKIHESVWSISRAHHRATWKYGENRGHY